MNSAIVSYFTSHNIRVMLSINGQTYTTHWDQALSQNARALELGEYVDAVRRTGHHSSERALGGEGIRAFDHSAEKNWRLAIGGSDNVCHLVLHAVGEGGDRIFMGRRREVKS